MATGTLGTQARDYHQRQTTYLTQQIDGTSTGNFPVSGHVKIGTIPLGAAAIRAGMCMTTAFDGTTTQTISIGVTSGGATWFAAAAAGMVTLGHTAITLIATAAGLPATADTDVWINNTSTGAQTVGRGFVYVEYIVPTPGLSPSV